MKVTQIELFRVKIPLADNTPGFFSTQPYFTPSWIPGFRQSEMRFYLLKIAADNGLSGFSAMPAMSTERDGLGPVLGSYLLGINPLDIKLVNQRIQEFAYIGMRNGWIETAFWDLLGKIKQKPIYELLGGKGGSVYPYISTGSTNNHDAKKIKELSEYFKNKGYKGIKLRVKSLDMKLMLDYIESAATTIDGKMDIMVDANQGWPVNLIDETPIWDKDFALEFANRLKQFDVKWLEEPLNKGDLDGLQFLTKNSLVPIAGCEMNSSWVEINEMLRKKCLHIFQPDAILCGGTYAGGITVINWIIGKIREHNENNNDFKMKYCPHTWTTGLGFALGLQLVGVLNPEERSLIEYPWDGNWKHEHWNRFIKNSFEPDSEGKIKIPDEPGLGIEIDMDIIKKYGKRIYNATPMSLAIFTLRDRKYKQAMYLKQKKEEQAKENDTVKDHNFILPPLFE